MTCLRERHEAAALSRKAPLDVSEPLHGPSRIPGQATVRPPRGPGAPRRLRGDGRSGRRRSPTRLGYPCVVKAQVLIGGRGKAGGIKVAQNRDEVARARRGDPRHGHPRPHRPRAVDRGGERHRLRATTRRSSSTARAKATLVMLSTQGGMDIEEVAEENPDAIARLHVDPLLGLPGLPRAAGCASRPASTPTSCARSRALLAKLYEAFVARGGDARRGQPADHQAATAPWPPWTRR